MRQREFWNGKEIETDLVPKGNRLIPRLDLYRSRCSVGHPERDNISSWRKCSVFHSKHW